LLVRVRGAGEEGDGLRLERKPVWAEATEVQRLALLENIALGATRMPRVARDSVAERTKPSAEEAREETGGDGDG
jgi:hypothetical protein